MNYISDIKLLPHYTLTQVAFAFKISEALEDYMYLLVFNYEMQFNFAPYLEPLSKFHIENPYK